MKLFIKNTIPWSTTNARWEIRDTKGILADYENAREYHNETRAGATFNGVLRTGSNPPVEIRTDLSGISLRTLFSSMKNPVQPPYNYPYKFYENNVFIGGAAQVTEKRPGRMTGYTLIRCYYKNDIYEAYQVPVSHDDIEVYIYKNSQTVAVVESVSVVLNGQVEYYLYTEDGTELTPLLLILLCYDMYYFMEVLTITRRQSYPSKYEKLDYTNVPELIMKMDPQFFRALYERHKNDTFV